MLFSEPKIPQSPALYLRGVDRARRFSALQRAENSSMYPPLPLVAVPSSVSVLFSEPKIPQFQSPPFPGVHVAEFQCSSASRKFLNPDDSDDYYLIAIVSVLFSEPKIPQFGTG